VDANVFLINAVFLFIIMIGGLNTYGKLVFEMYCPSLLHGTTSEKDGKRCVYLYMNTYIYIYIHTYGKLVFEMYVAWNN
jgi:hypothetical protein